MEIIAAIVLLLTGIVLILSLVRLMQRAIARGGRPEAGMWIILIIMVLMSGTAVYVAVYLLFTQ